jgi:methanogen homocitrate synthase
MWSVSPYNFSNNIAENLKTNIEVHDTTLRDGLSDPARALFVSSNMKAEIAKVLDELGIRRIEIGIAAKDFLGELKELASLNLQAKTFVMTPTSTFQSKGREAIDIAIEAGVSGVVLNFPISTYLVKHYLPGWEMQKVIDKSVSMARYAKEQGLYVNFFPYDTTRADPDVLEKNMRSAVDEAGVDTVSIIDTLGVGSPHGIATLVQMVAEWVDVPIELHMHNDFGLALANTLAGIESGAQAVHTAITGIGKMPATEDVITCLQILYGRSFEVEYRKLFDCCHRIRRIGNWEIDPCRPIIGRLAFGYDSDERLNENRSQKAPFLPEFIGNQYQFIVSGGTGPEGIKWNLKRVGKEASPEEIDRIRAAVKKEWSEKRRALSDEEFTYIVEKIVG